MKELKNHDRNNTRSGRDASNDRERRTDGDRIGVDRMNMETLLEAYNYELRERIKVENACQDILFILDEAFSNSPPHSAGDYLRQIAKRLESVL